MIEPEARNMKLGGGAPFQNVTEHPSIAEFPNTECRNHGLFRVGSLAKALSTVLWHVTTFNFLRQQHPGVL